MPQVSVIIPFYNSEEYLGQAIESVLKQDFTDWELILVDDSSHDNSVLIAKSYSDMHAKIKLIQLKENCGAGTTRNTGIRESSGKYLAFLDADDIWEHQKLTKQLKFIKDKNAAISYTGYSFIDQNSLPIRGRVEALPEMDLNKYMQTTGIGLSTAIIDRDKFSEIHFSDMRMRQDTELWMRLLSENIIAYGLNEDLVKYRKRQK